MSAAWPFDIDTPLTPAIKRALLRLKELDIQRDSLQRQYHDAIKIAPGMIGSAFDNRAVMLLEDLDAEYELAQDDLWRAFIGSAEFFIPGHMGMTGGRISKKWPRIE